MKPRIESREEKNMSDVLATTRNFSPFSLFFTLEFFSLSLSLILVSHSLNFFAFPQIQRLRTFFFFFTRF